MSLTATRQKTSLCTIRPPQNTVIDAITSTPGERVSSLAGWLLLRASDLSTRLQHKGHAMVTTGTEDKGSILESGPERLLTLLRKAAGA